jgi:molecular chaperone GrpE
LRSSGATRWFSQQNGDSNKQESAQQEQQQQPPLPDPALTKRISELESEVKRLKQEVLYSLADQENTRRIAKKDVADAKAFGVKDFAKSLLDVADTLQKAVESAIGLQTSDAKVQSMVEGVRATETNMLKALKSNGVEGYGAQGDKFDPNKHEALAQVPDARHAPNSIYQVLRRGWTLNGRVLRPAQVVTTIPAPEIEPAFLERKVGDKVDEADDVEITKNKNSGAKRD